MLEILVWETSREFFDTMFRAMGGWNATAESEPDDVLTYCAGGEL